MTHTKPQLQNQVRAVLFDLDGTLVDSAPDLAAAANQLRVKRGLEALPLASYRHMVGAGARGMLGIAFGMTPENAEFNALKEAFFANYERCLTQSTQAFAGVPELLATLQASGLKWGVVTNKATRFTQPLTAGMTLFANAGCIVSGDTTPHAKPHPAPLLHAAELLKLAPAQCLYVGDDERDIQAGRAAGMSTVAVSYGYLGAHSSTAAWGADFNVDAPHEILALLGVSTQSR
jgi:N-acetyl-D-muramate 6-phosphate phosphatase